MNIHLYRTYLLITKLETLKTQYGHILYRQMLNKFPELRSKTLQNILDQRRQLFLRNRLPPGIVTQIRTEVAIELGLQAPAIQAAVQDQVNITIMDPFTPEERVILDRLNANIMKYQGTSPSCRPKIPRLKTNIDTKKILGNMNKVLPQATKDCNDVEMLHCIIYAAAITVLELHKQKMPRDKTNSNPTVTTPAWEARLSRKIDACRRELGILTQYTRQATPSNKLKKKALTVLASHQNETDQTPIEVRDRLKQKLQVYANRLRRYKKAYQRRIDNNTFHSSQRYFYRGLENQNPDQNPDQQPDELPDDNSVKDFWGGIWENPTSHTRNTKWLQQERKRVNRIPTMLPQTITTEEVKEALKKTTNWKSPGPDHIQNYWYKRLYSTHELMARLLDDLLKNPENTPPFMTTGVTYLLPKTTPAHRDPSKYRPITCLPTLYKLLSGIIAEKIYKHMVSNNLLAEEQKGCRKYSQGCKEQLVVDTIITEDAKKQRKNLFTAYIDYKKAFDSIPHTWLIESLGLYKVDTQVINLLQNLMNTWQTHIKSNDPGSPGVNIKIQRGIFQGDALSALWFCVALNPLSNDLNTTQMGYQLPEGDVSITHLLYMDDVKLFSESELGLKKLIRSTENFSNDIRMEFGLDKCRYHSLKNGKWSEADDFQLLQRSKGGTIQAMDKHETYKYLGFLQAQGLDNKEIKNQLQTKMKSRLKAILRTQLSAINKTTAINSFAAPVLTYSFGVVPWTNTELERSNRDLRVEYTKHKMHHPRASRERFHLPRKLGGRGVTDLRMCYRKYIQQLRNYFINKSRSSPYYATIVASDKNYSPLKLANTTYVCDHEYTTESLLTNWKSKELHGRYINSVERREINTLASFGWLTNGNIFAETEGFLTAIQDQVIPTKSYLKYIVKDENITDTRCRLCNEANETIEHIIGSCKKMAPKEYTNRHNNVAKIIHNLLALKYNLATEDVPYYKYQPPSVMESSTITLYWDRELQTDHPITNNRPDIFIFERDKEAITLVDVAIPTPNNIIRKHTEKIEKYLPLADELKSLWHAKTVRIIPIILGATGEIPDSLLDSLQQLGLKSSLYLKLQKTTILDTCHIVRKVLNVNITLQQP